MSNCSQKIIFENTLEEFEEICEQIHKEIIDSNTDLIESSILWIFKTFCFM